MNAGYFKTTLLVISVVFFLNQCGGDARILVKQSTGLPGEFVVVADSRYVIAPHPIMDSVKSWFERPLRALLQPEPTFKVYKIDDAHFGSVFKYHRNILLLNIGAPPDAPVVAMQYDKWALRQLVVQLNVPSEAEFFKIFSEKRDEIEALFRDHDILRLAEDFDKSPASEAREMVLKSTGVSISLPSGFFCADTSEGIAFVRHVAERSISGGHKGVIERGLIIFSLKYFHPNQFSTSSFLEDIKSPLRKKVQGAKDSTWMEIEPRVSCDSSAIRMGNSYGLRVKGLWRLHGEFKGGPFVAIRFYEESLKKLYTIFGYVYAPAFPKRQYLYQVEAIARSAFRPN